ncbi:hypothetical protein D3C76_1676010 [compost metagenome]
MKHLLETARSVDLRRFILLQVDAHQRSDIDNGFPTDSLPYFRQDIDWTEQLRLLQHRLTVISEHHDQTVD